MADATTYPVKVVTPEGVAFEGDVQIAIATSAAGELGIMAKHTPLVADLKLGRCSLHLPNGEWKHLVTSEGFLQVEGSSALVLVEEAVDVNDIDLSEADELISDANNQISSLDSGEHDVYSSTKDSAQRSIAWGEHLKAMHGKFAAS